MMSIFPGGSKSRVNAAGNSVRKNCATEEDLRVIDEWRSAHSAVLNTFQAMLRNRAKDYGGSVVQRLKRKFTIFDKLNRQGKMELSRMEDIAGCRVILPDIKILQEFRASLHHATIKHVLKYDPDKYNYIRQPKPDGYRGIHDVYEYNVNSTEGAHLKGLRVEIQYRTFVQHSWATTNEILGFITESHPKYHRGDPRFVEVMALTSEILARGLEGRSGPFGSWTKSQVLGRFYELDEELGLLLRLKALQVVDQTKSSTHRHVVLSKSKRCLTATNFETSEAAMAYLFEKERLDPYSDTVYVTGETVDGIRLGYKNYYDDATEFLTMLEDAKHEMWFRPSHI
nr:RelA/SpoT domain-containing protein [Rhodoferax sp.]